MTWSDMARFGDVYKCPEGLDLKVGSGGGVHEQRAPGGEKPSRESLTLVASGHELWLDVRQTPAGNLRPRLEIVSRGGVEHHACRLGLANESLPQFLLRMATTLPPCPRTRNLPPCCHSQRTRP